MKNIKYLHLMHNEKFIAPFIAFIKDHFDFDEHVFILVGGVSESIAKIPNETNVLYVDNSYNNKYNYFKLSKVFKKYAYDVEKIILHGIFTDNKLFFLYLNQNLLYKCYWVMWGGDLYVYTQSRTRVIDKIRHSVRKSIYSKIGHLITYVQGDFALAQKWYNVQGKYHECFMYPSNLYKEYDIKPKQHSTVHIQVGNSIDPSNNHIEVFNKLKKYQYENIKIIVPLSYGDQEYVKEVIEQGKKVFGDKFVPLTEFMPFDTYLDVLSNIDIAIFNHNRQQAMGNIITLLGLGKKVYIRDDISSWSFFEEHNLKIFSISGELNLEPLDNEVQLKNRHIIKAYFSGGNLHVQLERIFNA